MARQLKTSGIATNLRFLMALDDSATPVPTVYRAYDGSNNLVTVACNDDKTLGANLATATMAWGDKTVPYMSNGTDYTWITFGVQGAQTKPNLRTMGGGVGTYFFIGRVPSALANERILFGGVTNNTPQMGTMYSSAQWWAGLLTYTTSWLAWSAGGYPTTSADETWAFVYNSATGTNNCKFYGATAGVAMSQTPFTHNNADGWNADGDLTWLGGTSVNANWGNGRIVMIGQFTGEVAAADLAALHADPFGTLFEGGGVVTVDYPPTADVATGGWTYSAGSTLYECIDDASPDTSGSDYIQSPANPTGQIAKVRFQTLQIPSTNTSHKVSYIIKREGNVALTVTLKAGNGDTIATWTHNTAGYDEAWTSHEQTLSPENADAWAAAGYANSELWFTAG
jgi:hypothetical protein